MKTELERLTEIARTVELHYNVVVTNIFAISNKREYTTYTNRSEVNIVTPVDLSSLRMLINLLRFEVEFDITINVSIGLYIKYRSGYPGHYKLQITGNNDFKEIHFKLE